MADLSVATAVTANGVVSHLERHQDVSGGGSASVRTTHETRFRVGGKPFVVRGTHTISDGDHVAVVGHPRGDAVRVFAMRNLSTGTGVTFTHGSTRMMYVCYALGVLLLPAFGLGLVFLGLGYLAQRNLNREKRLLDLLGQTVKVTVT